MWLVKQLAKRSRGSDLRSYALLGCVALLALLLLGASWSAASSSREREAARDWQLHTLDVLMESDAMRVVALQMMRGTRGYLLTQSNDFLRPYHKARAAWPAHLGNLARLTADNPRQQRRIGSLSSEFNHLDEVFAKMIALERDGRNTEAVALVKTGVGRLALETIMRELDGIAADERALLARRTERAETAARRNDIYQYCLTLVGLLLLALSLVAAVFVRRALAAEGEARRRLQTFASTDTLSGLPNRRSFMDALERSTLRAEGDTSRHMAVAIFDIDHFKGVNDRYGHPAGDEVIVEVARRALDAVRGRDLVARIGGEEFGVILPAADIETARVVCERMREAICSKPVRTGSAIVPVTVSVGLAEWEHGDSGARLLARADAALYVAKGGGRNQVRLAG